MGFLKNFVNNSTSGVDRLRADVRADAKTKGTKKLGRKPSRADMEREVTRRMNGKSGWN